MIPTPQDIAIALTKAGCDRLPAPALAYIGGRMGRSDLTRLNLGGLRPISYGCAKPAEIGAGEPFDPAFIRGTVDDTEEFEDLDAAARALVSVAYRAAPRAWGQVGEAELATLGSYPIHRAKVGAAKAVNDLGESIDTLKTAVDGLAADIGATPSPIPGLPSVQDTLAAAQQVLSQVAPQATASVDMGPRKVYPSGISPEMESTMRALVADWEGFDRLGVGTKVLPDLRPAVEQFRKLRDAWKAGSNDPAVVSQEIDAATKAASQVREALAKAGVIDPALGPAAIKATQEAILAAQQAAAASSKSWLDNVPALKWLSNPNGPTVRVTTDPIVPAEWRAPIVVGVAGLAIVGAWFALSSRKASRSAARSG